MFIGRHSSVRSSSVIKVRVTSARTGVVLINDKGTTAVCHGILDITVGDNDFVDSTMILERPALFLFLCFGICGGNLSLRCRHVLRIFGHGD